jgi:hypothetical protein
MIAGANVMSMFGAMFQKYGIRAPNPYSVEFMKRGVSTPDLRFTVLSGCEK